MSSGARETAWLMGANTRVGTPMHSPQYQGTKPGYNTEVQYKAQYQGTIQGYNTEVQYKVRIPRYNSRVGTVECTALWVSGVTALKLYLT